MAVMERRDASPRNSHPNSQPSSGGGASGTSSSAKSAGSVRRCGGGSDGGAEGRAARRAGRHGGDGSGAGKSFQRVDELDDDEDLEVWDDARSRLAVSTPHSEIGLQDLFDDLRSARWRYFFSVPKVSK